jgi:hypothetical protein
LGYCSQWTIVYYEEAMLEFREISSRVIQSPLAHF